jgi:hypothetical protein
VFVHPVSHCQTKRRIQPTQRKYGHVEHCHKEDGVVLDGDEKTESKRRITQARITGTATALRATHLRVVLPHLSNLRAEEALLLGEIGCERCVAALLEPYIQLKKTKQWTEEGIEDNDLRDLVFG